MSLASLMPLPTRRDEAYRYADLEALTDLWPVVREEIVVAAGDSGTRSFVELGAARVARHLLVTLEPGARFDVRVLTAGAAYGRIAIDVRLGKGAEFTLGAAQLGKDGQVLELVTQVHHDAPDAVSRQVIRSVIGTRATATYLGRVAVARGANGTNAGQSVRAMLLDRTATANAKPELEIFADDVKCAHGCAVGELDTAGLFYLESRGLTPALARRLMLQAFVAEAFAGAPEEARLQTLALERLETMV